MAEARIVSAEFLRLRFTLSDGPPSQRTSTCIIGKPSKSDLCSSANRRRVLGPFRSSYRYLQNKVRHSHIDNAPARQWNIRT
jgi:hypothetical protein